MQTLMMHESCELNELLASCTNSLNSMGLFVNQVQCQELKAMIERHMKAHIQDYNMKVEWANEGSCQDTLDVPVLPKTASVSTAIGNFKKSTPNPNATKLDDRAIATSYLLTLKRSGRDYAWAAFECANPQLRGFLEDAFEMCSHQAFEVSEYMMKKGFYPIEPAPATYLQALSNSYESVQNSGYVH